VAANLYLALGSNLGDRLAAINDAVRRLGESLTVEAVSPIYETDAIADQPQPPYLNAVLRARTELAPRAVLELALGVERAMGRVRPAGRVRAPRIIDIDVLLCGGLVAAEPGLAIPHPALLARAFVRIPLADVAAPGLAHPLTGERLDRAAPDPGVRRLPGP